MMNSQEQLNDLKSRLREVNKQPLVISTDNFEMVCSFDTDYRAEDPHKSLVIFDGMHACRSIDLPYFSLVSLTRPEKYLINDLTVMSSDHAEMLKADIAKSLFPFILEASLATDYMMISRLPCQQLLGWCLHNADSLDLYGGGKIIDDSSAKLMNEEVFSCNFGQQASLVDIIMHHHGVPLAYDYHDSNTYKDPHDNLLVLYPCKTPEERFHEAVSEWGIPRFDKSSYEDGLYSRIYGIPHVRRRRVTCQQ